MADGTVVKDHFHKFRIHFVFFFICSMVLAGSTAAGGASVTKTLERTLLQQFPDQSAIFYMTQAANQCF